MRKTTTSGYGKAIKIVSLVAIWSILALALPQVSLELGVFASAAPENSENFECPASDLASDRPALNTGCDVGPYAMEGAVQNCIDMGIRRCWYTLDASKDASKNEPAPLLIAMHGFNSCPKKYNEYSKWSQLAQREGFILVFPLGNVEKEYSDYSCFNAGSLLVHCAKSNGSQHGSQYQYPNIPDVEFLQQLIGNVVAETPNVDLRRIYVTGHSNGCAMAQRLVSEAGGAIAALSCHSSPLVTRQLPGSSEGYRATPIQIFHGDDDRTVRYQGAAYPHAIVNVDRWARANGCKRSHKYQDDSGSYTTHAHDECHDGVRVELVQLHDVGHRPFRGQGGCQIDTTSMAWEFLTQFQNSGTPNIPSAKAKVC